MKSFNINTCNRLGNYLSFSGTQVLAKESLTRSTPVSRQDNYPLDHHQATLHRFLLSTYQVTIQQTFPDGIYKPIPDKILSPLQMAYLSPSPNGISKPIPASIVLTSANLRAL